MKLDLGDEARFITLGAKLRYGLWECCTQHFHCYLRDSLRPRLSGNDFVFRDALRFVVLRFL